MTDLVQAALISSIPPTIAAIGAIVIGLRTHEKVGLVQKEMNGMQDKLLQSTGKEAYARGVKDEKESKDTNS